MVLGRVTMQLRDEEKSVGKGKRKGERPEKRSGRMANKEEK